RRHTRFSRDWSSDVCSSDLRDALSVSRAVFTHQKQVLAELDFEENILEDAHASLKALLAMNIKVKIISGDRKERVAALASKLGRSEERRVGKEYRTRWEQDR